MPDRKKVIKAVETCFDSWIDKHRNMGLDLQTVEQMKRDALELLQEQEPVRPEREGSGSGVTWWNVCGSCRTAINPNDKYCHECGRAVEWNG